MDSGSLEEWMKRESIGKKGWIREAGKQGESRKRERGREGKAGRIDTPNF